MLITWWSVHAILHNSFVWRTDRQTIAIFFIIALCIAVVCGRAIKTWRLMDHAVSLTGRQCVVLSSSSSRQRLLCTVRVLGRAAGLHDGHVHESESNHWQHASFVRRRLWSRSRTHCRRLECKIDVVHHSVARDGFSRNWDVSFGDLDIGRPLLFANQCKSSAIVTFRSGQNCVRLLSRQHCCLPVLLYTSVTN